MAAVTGRVSRGSVRLVETGNRRAACRALVGLQQWAGRNTLTRGTDLGIAIAPFPALDQRCFLTNQLEGAQQLEKMLRDVGLDEESVAKLKIPPLPF